MSFIQEYRVRRLRLKSLILNIILATLSPLFGGCDEELSGRESPIILVTPSRIDLPAIPQGQTTSRTIELSNAGLTTLQVISIDFSNSISSLEFSKTHPELPILIEPDQVIEITVTYTPTDSGNDSGSLIIQSNSSTGKYTEVPISTASGATDLIFDARVDLSTNPCLEDPTIWHDFLNLGATPMLIEAVSIAEGSSNGFEITGYRITRSGQDVPEIIATPVGVSVANGDLFEVGLQYNPPTSREGLGTLNISYQGDEGTPHQVLLNGVPFGAPVEVIPVSVEFGAHDLGVESPISMVEIVNRGLEPLNVERIELALNAEGINEQFTLHNVEVPAVLAPEERVSFGVSYTPAMSGTHRTSAAVIFGACQGQVSVPITGRLKEPCIQATPEEVNFRVVAQGQPSAPFLVEILNCGDVPLDISAVDITGGQSGFSWTWVDQNTRAPFVLDPLSTELIEVTFTNTGLAEGMTRSEQLVIDNSSPQTPQLEVPLTVTGGGSPTCLMQIIPDRMNFGLVTRGRSVSRQLRAANRGTGSCELRAQSVEPLIPIPGLNVVFQLTQPIIGQTAAAGQFLPFEITYSPELFNLDAATYQLTYYDPFLGQERMATADLSGVSGESDIEVIPGRLDFGQVTAGQCASREERITVYNTGMVDLCITGMRLDGENCSEFVITNRPVADPDGCIIVSRNQPAEVNLVYEPGNLGEDSCDLVFISDANDTPELRVPLAGEGVSNSDQVDEFVQTSGQTVDVLFIIDDSGSMSEEQDNLTANFARFIDGAQQFQNDYQIGVITTDMDSGDAGKLVSRPRIITRSPAVASEFERSASVGTNGSGTEKGLSAAQAALSTPLIYDSGIACSNNSGCQEPDQCIEGFCGGANRGFLREEAALELVFVSDEDDYSEANLNFYVDFFKNIKGFRNEGRFHANAIVGAENGRANSCSGAGGEASAGSRYVEVANRTNGRVFSICETDFGRPLQEIGNQAFGLPVQFFLTRPADRNTISVSVNGSPRNSGWSYDAQSNSIIFDESQVPQPGQRVRVSYNAQCFPRQ